MQIDNQNSRPFVSLTSPQSGQIYAVDEKSIISGVARDNDGDITRVDVEVFDVSNGFLNVFTGAVTEIESNGYWELEWDSRILTHNMQYLIKARSYDGYEYSDWMEVQVSADNPPDADNSRPTFDATNWQTEITLYCEFDTTSQNPCTTVEIDLLEFFDDVDGVNSLILSVYDDPARSSDDEFGLVINIGIDGVAFYDPKSMGFYNEDMDTWSLSNVIFVATDQYGSKEISTPVSFNVVPIEFYVGPPDQTTASDDELIFFSGSGLPGKTVRVTLGGIQVNSTVVLEDSTWELGIPGAMLSKPVIPVFSISGSESIQGEEISPPSSGGGISAVMIIAIVFAIIALLAGTLFFSGVIAFEEDDEEYDEAETDDSKGLRSEDHPGWLWDPEKEEWVPDPDHIGE